MKNDKTLHERQNDKSLHDVEPGYNNARNASRIYFWSSYHLKIFK